MTFATYCPKCKKNNLFGDVDVVSIARFQAKKEKIGLKKSEYIALYKRYIKEKNILPAGCVVNENCIVCKTRLIQNLKNKHTSEC